MFQARGERKGVGKWAKRWETAEPHYSLSGNILGLFHSMTTTDILVARSVPCGKGIWEVLGAGIVFCYSCLFFFSLAVCHPPPKTNWCFINKDEGENESALGSWQSVTASSGRRQRENSRLCVKQLSLPSFSACFLENLGTYQKKVWCNLKTTRKGSILIVECKFLNESEVKVTWSCPTLCDPIDYRVHGILQARILE